MKEEISIYKARVQTFQMSTLIIQIFLMMIGGCVFGLGVVTRPILRITKPEFFFHVEWILDMMVATGLAQLATAGLDCFAACWTLIWPIYLGIGLTSMTVFLELGALGTSLQLVSKAESMVNEDVVHPWYWVECQSMASCHDAMLAYIFSYVLPQIVLVAIAIFLQCLGIMYLGKLVRTVADHQKTVVKYGKWYREHHEKPDPKPAHPDPPIEIEEKEQVETEVKENDQATLGQELTDPDYHSPSSILKADHGYVPASGASLDYDDSYMRKKSFKDKAPPSQTISFNTNVQVHYYDAKLNLLASGKKNSTKSTSQVKLIGATEDDEMNDLTPETIQLQQVAAEMAKSGNCQKRNLDLARVASNLSKLLAADSPESSTTSSGPVKLLRPTPGSVQPAPPAPPPTPMGDENVSFNFSPVPPPIIKLQSSPSPSTPVVQSPMPSTSGGLGNTKWYNPLQSFTPKSFD